MSNSLNSELIPIDTTELTSAEVSHAPQHYIQETRADHAKENAASA